VAIVAILFVVFALSVFLLVLVNVSALTIFVFHITHSRF